VPLLAAGLATAWWWFWSEPVRFPGDGAGGFSIGNAVAGQPVAVGGLHLCLDGAETAVIEQITVDGGGLTVTDFTVRRMPTLPATGPGTGQEQPLPSTGDGGRTIGGQCADGVGSEIDVWVTKATSATARTDVLAVHWSSGIRSGTVETPVRVVLCEGEETADPNC
jgi:hypothetical protein